MTKDTWLQVRMEEWEKEQLRQFSKIIKLDMSEAVREALGFSMDNLEQFRWWLKEQQEAG